MSIANRVGMFLVIVVAALEKSALLFSSTGVSVFFRLNSGFFKSVIFRRLQCKRALRG